MLPEPLLTTVHVTEPDTALSNGAVLKIDKLRTKKKKKNQVIQQQLSIRN